MKTSRITEHRLVSPEGRALEWTSKQAMQSWVANPYPYPDWTIETRTITTEERELPVDQWLQLNKPS